MSRVYCMITITGRNNGEKFSALFREEQLPVTLVTLGTGTAGSEILDCFGLETSEKIVLFCVVTDETWNRLRQRMENKLKIDVPGMGISFLVPMSSVGGGRTLGFLLDGQTFEKEEESSLKNTEYELIVVISDYGYTGMVMDAARQAGAGGGTVIHTKGTGMERSEKFLGVTLAAEKEMILIVARSEQKNGIMQAVMEKAGTESKARSIVFSLPVSEAAGLRITNGDPV